MHGHRFLVSFTRRWRVRLQGTTPGNFTAILVRLVSKRSYMDRKCLHCRNSKIAYYIFVSTSRLGLAFIGLISVFVKLFNLLSLSTKESDLFLLVQVLNVQFKWNIHLITLLIFIWPNWDWDTYKTVSIQLLICEPYFVKWKCIWKCRWWCKVNITGEEPHVSIFLTSWVPVLHYWRHKIT